MNELFNTYDETLTQLLTRLEGDLATRSSLKDAQWTEALAEIRQNMVHMRDLPAEELDVALTAQRTRLTRLGQLYLRLSRGNYLD